MTEKYGIKLPALLGEVTIEDPQLVHKIVDLLAIPAEAAANLSASLIKVLGIPVVAAETYGRRLISTIGQAQAQVPPERQIPPAPSVAGPILESVKYLEEGNPLLEMFVNLLARSMDRDRVGEAHPAFPGLIAQLSADEALLLYFLSKTQLTRVQHYDSYPAQLGLPPQRKRIDENSTSWLVKGLQHKQHESIYMSRLLTLNLIGVDPRTATRKEQQDEQGRTYCPTTETTTIVLSDFGRLFASACIPDHWEPSE